MKIMWKILTFVFGISYILMYLVKDPNRYYVLIIFSIFFIGTELHDKISEIEKIIERGK